MIFFDLSMASGENILALSSTISLAGISATDGPLSARAWPLNARPPRTVSTPKYRRYAVISGTPVESQVVDRFIPLFDTGGGFFNENPYAQSAIMFRDFRRRVWSPNLSRPSWISIVHPLPGGPNAANACDDDFGRPPQGEGGHRRGRPGDARERRHEERRAQDPQAVRGEGPGRLRRRLGRCVRPFGAVRGEAARSSGLGPARG